MKALKTLFVLALVLVGMVAVSGIANADSVPVAIEKVYINDRAVEDGEVRAGIIRGDTVDIEVKLEANATDRNVVVEATIEGLDHDAELAEDKTDAFTVDSGKTYYKNLQIELPERMDVEQYALRIEVSNREDDEVVYNAVLEVDQERNAMNIKDVLFSPEGQVKAGRALLTTVRMKNMGEDEEEDVKVRVSIPELGISASDYIDEVESEDTVTSEELYMRIPECAEAGQYTATVNVEFDEGDESVTESYMVNVVESDACGVGVDKTVIAVSTDSQEITAGASGAVYPLTISNTASSAKTYTISAEAGAWADVKVSPSVAVLAAGETKVAYVYVSAEEEATAGEKTIALTVSSGSETLKTVTLNANVVEPEESGWDKVKKGLEVALVVLVVLLVVIGLIVGFNRLKGDEDEDKEETYY